MVKRKNFLLLQKINAYPFEHIVITSVGKSVFTSADKGEDDADEVELDR
jgi:hypothetical protein